MRIAVINVDCGIGGSTGRIASEIVKEGMGPGDKVFFAYGREGRPDPQFDVYRIGNRLSILSQVFFTRLFDLHGQGCYFATKCLIKKLNEFNPDLLWLHNLHGYYLDYYPLFKWIKSRPYMQVKWLLHDCWTFTGHCSHFSIVKCDKWQEGCNHCPQKHEYPSSWFADNSKNNFSRKKAAFLNVRNMTLITPSQWLADLVKKSFLKDYSVLVRHNKVDRNIFKPIPNDFRKRYGLENKKIVLGIANVWSDKKGLSDFVKLSKMLDDTYVIVEVGLTEKQIAAMPNRIVAIKKTNNINELVEIYSAANVFVNLTYEDNYPTTNLEAQACGTPCITYRTGGSPESVPSENVIEQGDLLGVKNMIETLVKKEC